VLYACANSDLSGWSVRLAPGDVMEGAQWFFEGLSQELVGTETHGLFFAGSSFSGRVAKTTNAGIDVQHVQVRP
jgi:hypothetical protein